MQLYPPFQNRACGTREKPSIGPLVTGTPARMRLDGVYQTAMKMKQGTFAAIRRITA